MDEWGTWYDVEPGTNPGFLFQQNTLRDAVVAGLNLNVFHSHADRVRMTNIAQMINVLQAMILTDKEKMLLTPTYHVFEMYKPFQNATLLPAELTTPEYKHGEVAIPAVSVSAARDRRRRDGAGAGEHQPQQAGARHGQDRGRGAKKISARDPHHRRDECAQHLRQAQHRAARGVQRRQSARVMPGYSTCRQNPWSSSR